MEQKKTYQPAIKTDHAFRRMGAGSRQRYKVYGQRSRGRGAVSNSTGRYENQQRETLLDDALVAGDLNKCDNQTHVTVETAKSIITKNKSPDIPFAQSINTYRGCEHGCVYCFARQSHAYMGLSAGLDFERRLFRKADAARLLEQELSRKSYKMSPIALGTNTDPYQPIEKTYKTTREILEVLNNFNHPCSIVTKNHLVTRDADILADMASKGLVKVYMSVTTLNAKLARLMEPRASIPAKRLDALHLLHEAGIPTGVMVAPVIPAINDTEMEQILAAAKGAGVREAAYILLRLPREVADIFTEWLDAYFPDRKDRVLSRLKAMRGGRVNDPRYKHRMKGMGVEAAMIKRRFHIHCQRLGLNQGEQAHEMAEASTKDFIKKRIDVPAPSRKRHAEEALPDCARKIQANFYVPPHIQRKEDKETGQLNLFS